MGLAQTMSAPEIFSVLNPYKLRIEKLLAENIHSLGPKTVLRDACEYALLNGGKRFRPALVLMIADALGNPVDVSQAALAIEFFHTASLVADDLPCMDDDDERRDRPSLHKAYGEGVALLVSYALIAEGYGCLAKNAHDVRRAPVNFAADADRICVLALENATYNTGLAGATGGQFLDVFPPDLTLATLREVLHKKTVSLFEISFVFGWLFSGGKIEQLDRLKKAASHFGMAFQIADDLGDMDQDIKNERKVNVANVCGKEVAKEMFFDEVSSFQSQLRALGIDSKPLVNLAEILLRQVAAV